MEGHFDDDTRARDSRLPSSDDIRAMVDAAFSPGGSPGSHEDPSSSSPNSTEDAAPAVDSGMSPQADLSGLGGLGESEAVDSAGGGVAIDSNDKAVAIDAGTPRTRNSDTASEELEGDDSETTPRQHNAVAVQSMVSPCPKWSEVLRSPKRDAFSPSKDMNKGGNYHGLGLMVAVERAKKLSRCGKRCANLLADVAVLYANFAQAILKSCKTIGSANDGTSGFFAPPVSSVVTELKRSLISFAKQLQGLSICIKGSVARPLHGSASAMADTVPSIFNRYALTRAKCLASRQNAIRLRIKYVKALREAEAVIRDLQKARATDESQDTFASGASTPVRHSEDASDTVSDEILSPTAGNTVSLPPSDGIDAEQTPLSKKVYSRTGWDDMKKRFVKHGQSQKSEKVVKLLDDVQLFESNYCVLVEEENHAVSRSQTMEIMALEALQKLEEERLQFFIETLGRALQAEKGALDNMMLNLRRGSEESVASTLSTGSSNASQPLSQNPSSLFKRKASMPQSEEGSSVNEALALNMPEDIGRLRDTQKRNLAAQANRIYAVKAFSVFFQDISLAALSFSSDLHSRLANDGYAKGKPKTSEAISLTLNDFSAKAKPSETLAVALNECEGEKALSCLNQVMESLVGCAKSASELGTAMQNDGRKLLDKSVLTEKKYKTSLEGEEGRWKNCCDLSKELMKARTRLEQSRSELDKAHQRLSAAEEDIQGKQKGSSSLNKNPTMTKALGNMFSILPEEAMTKMLAPDQRLAIVSRNVKEATSKEAKEKQTYETLQSAKAKAVASYTAAAQAANAQYSSNEESAWSAVMAGVDVMVSLFQHYRESRYDSVDPATNWLHDNGTYVLGDMTQWTQSIQADIKRRSERDGDGQKTPGRTRKKHGRADDGYCLQVHLEDSKNVYKLIELVTNEAESGGQDESFSSELSVVEQNEVDQDSGDVTTKGQDSSELTPAIHAEARTGPSPSHPGKNHPVSKADLRQPSSNTKELMTLAATLKDNTDRPGASDKIPESESSATPKLGKADITAAASSKSAETELFLAHFWDGNESDGDTSPPTVIDSFSCAYWPKDGEGYFAFLLHGRLFVTSSALYFIGWGDKKIVLKWEDVTAVTKATNMMGALDNSLRVTFDIGEGESSYFFGSFAFREDAFQIMSRLSTVARSLRAIKGGKSAGRKDALPDEVLKKMEVVLKKKIKNVSIKRFYEKCWSEGIRTDAAPFYGPFLIAKKSFDVKVGEWDFADGESEGFESKWSGEKFPQKRVVFFKFKRTTHLYMGPPVAGVTQTQYCHVDGDDKCILAMTVEMDSIPYADTFAVEVRWVARRIGNKDISVEVGVFVVFKKSSILASKIRSGTVEETKPIHYALFDAVKAACAAEAEEESEEEEEEEEEAPQEREALEGNNMLRAIVSQISLLMSTMKAQGIKVPSIKTDMIPVEGAALRHIVSFVIMGLLFFLFTRQLNILPSVQPIVPHNEIDDLTKQMNLLQEEMLEVKALLREMLSVLKERK